MSADPLSLGGINNNKREEAPLTTVIKDMKTLKKIKLLNHTYVFQMIWKPEISNFICNKSSQWRSYDISHRNDSINQGNLKISVKVFDVCNNDYYLFNRKAKGPHMNNKIWVENNKTSTLKKEYELDPK